MNTAALIHFPKPKDEIKEADMTKQTRDSGYTPLPNYLVDDDYVARMSGNSLKCYTIINRFTKGFSRINWAMESGFLLNKTGIKKPHTLFEAVKQLEQFGLLSVHREDGKTNKFTVTDPCPKTALPKNGTTAENGHNTSAENGNKGTAENGHTKKENIKNNIKNIKKTTLPVDKSETDIFASSVEYHREDKKLFTLIELSKTYKVQSDFTAKAQSENPDMTKEQILAELKNFAQWSVAQDKRTAQSWMNNWVYRLQKLDPSKSKSKTTTTAKPKKLSDSQIDYFASKLCNFDEFASMYANVGESQKSFESRIAAKLRNPKHLKEFASYLHDVGFVGNLEDFA